jgi:hypothetical protein
MADPGQGENDAGISLRKERNQEHFILFRD